MADRRRNQLRFRTRECRANIGENWKLTTSTQAPIKAAQIGPLDETVSFPEETDPYYNPYTRYRVLSLTLYSKRGCLR